MNELLILTSDQLWNEARRDNRSAFEMLYRRMAIQLVNHAFRILKDEAKAEDVVQEVFISIYVKRNEIPADINIKGYLINAVKYRVSNALRDEMRKEKRLQDLAETMRDTDTDQTSSYERKELQQHIGKSIEKLPSKCRHAFQLNYYHNLSYKSVALRMGISVKTVEKHISNAMSALHDDLKNIISQS